MSYEDFLTRIEKLDLQAILSQIETDIASRNLQVVGWWVKYLAQSKVPPPPKYKPVSYVNNLIGNDFTKHGKECYQIEKSNVLLSMAYTKKFDDWYDRREKLTNAMYNMLSQNFSGDWSVVTDSQILSELAYDLMLTTTFGSDLPTSVMTMLGVKTILTMMCGNPSFTKAVSKNDGATFFAAIRTLSRTFEYNDTLRTMYEKTISVLELPNKTLPDVTSRLSKKIPAKVLDDGTGLFILHHELFTYLSYPYHIAKMLSGVLACKLGVIPRFPAYARSVDVSNFLSDVVNNYELKSTWPQGEGNDSRSIAWSCDDQEPIEKMVQNFLDWQQSQPPIEWSNCLISSLMSLYKFDEKMYAINRLHSLADLIEGWGGYYNNGSPIGNRISRRSLAMALEFVLAIKNPSEQITMSAQNNGALVVVYPGYEPKDDEKDGDYDDQVWEIRVTYNLDGSYNMKTSLYSDEVSSDDES
jgi:hypothetical protein